MRGHGNPVVMRLAGERNALLEFYQETRHRTAFRALAEIGLAVAYGQLYLCADAQVSFANNRYGRISITTSVDAWYLQLAMRGCLP